MDPRDRIIVALDTHDQAELLRLARTLGPHVGGFKIGLEALLGIGLKECLNTVGAYGRQRRCVFVDAKLHDIPNTMAGAAKAIVQHPNVMFFNVHASAGLEGMKAAAKMKGDVKLLAVTVLTSIDTPTCQDIYGATISDKVGRFAWEANEAGCDGVVCSPEDLKRLHHPLMADDYKGLMFVTPGVRPKWSAKNDQERVTTPAEAIGNGATHLVVGRPITQPPETITPVAAARMIADEIAEALV